jgi:hypothetical protein
VIFLWFWAVCDALGLLEAGLVVSVRLEPILFANVPFLAFCLFFSFFSFQLFRVMRYPC